MAIPSESNFESYFSVAEWVPKEFLERLGKPGDQCDIDLTFEGIKSFLREVDNAKLKHKQIAFAHDVAKWFDNQPSVSRSIPILFGPKKAGKKFDQEEFLNRRAQRIFEKIKTFANGKLNTIDWEISLEREIESDPLWWWADFVKAFYNYFYTNRWQCAIQVARDAEKTLNSAIEAFKTLEDIQAKMEVMKDFYVGTYRLMIGNGCLGRKEPVITALQSDNFVFHTTREDKTAKERMLIFDLSRLFLKHFRSEKQTAIFHLMMTEGVVHPLDQRTIERMIEKWRNKKEALRRQKNNRHFSVK